MPRALGNSSTTWQRWRLQMTDVPAAVTSALAERRNEQALTARGAKSTSRVAAGDLRAIEALAHQPTDRRIGLVLRVDTSNEFADVLLAHSAPERATDRDAILAADIVSAPCDLVIQTDLRAAVWTFQLGHSVGHLDEESLGAVKDIVGRDGTDEPASQHRTEDGGIFSGTRLAGPLDGRWSFKASEGDALRRLAADCTEALLDKGLVWRVEQRLLRPDLLDIANDPVRVLIEFLHWVRTRPLALTDEDLEVLLSVGALEPDSWAQASDLGTDLLMSIQKVALSAATGVIGKPEHELRCLLAAEYPSHAGPPEMFDRIHYLGEKELVAA